MFLGCVLLKGGLWPSSRRWREKRPVPKKEPAFFLLKGFSRAVVLIFGVLGYLRGVVGQKLRNSWFLRGTGVGIGRFPGFLDLAIIE